MSGVLFLNFILMEKYAPSATAELGLRYLHRSPNTVVISGVLEGHAYIIYVVKH